MSCGVFASSTSMRSGDPPSRASGKLTSAIGSFEFGSGSGGQAAAAGGIAPALAGSGVMHRELVVVCAPDAFGPALRSDGSVVTGAGSGGVRLQAAPRRNTERPTDSSRPLPAADETCLAGLEDGG
jgi:hypothetical protein